MGSVSILIKICLYSSKTAKVEEINVCKTINFSATVASPSVDPLFFLKPQALDILYRVATADFIEKR